MTRLIKPGDIDREKTCPMLVRVFCKLNGHNRPEDYEDGHVPSKEEHNIYTWRDATLREITELIKAVNNEARNRKSKLSFSRAFPDRGRMVLREMGTCYSRQKGKDDERTLGELRFEPGDFLDVAIFIS